MNLQQINPTVQLGRNVRVIAEEVQLGNQVWIGDNVSIQVKRLILGDNVHIEHDTVILAESFEIGLDSRVEARCRIAGLRGGAKAVRIGEHTVLAHDCKLLVSYGAIGDYTAIHNHTLINGRMPFIIGHNVWIGQNCILNAEDRLTIGNHVGIGAYSMIYTHGYFGDLLEGSNVFKVAPVELQDDVWILGSMNIVSPGVTIGAKALVLTGSNVTKDVPSNHTIGGSPARDLTDHVIPYRDVPVEEKFERIQKFVCEFLEEVYVGNYYAVENGFVVDQPGETFRVVFERVFRADMSLPPERPLLVFTQQYEGNNPPAQVTIFDLAKRQYWRTRTVPEIKALSFLKSYRARFVPADQPRVLSTE